MGELFLVGMGPGDLPGLTQRAREALEGAEVVIGYSTYVKLLEEMGLLAGKEVVRKGMTEELTGRRRPWSGPFPAKGWPSSPGETRGSTGWRPPSWSSWKSGA